MCNFCQYNTIVKYKPTTCRPREDQKHCFRVHGYNEWNTWAMWNYDHKHTHTLVLYTITTNLETSVKCNTSGPFTRSLPTDVTFVNTSHKTLTHTRSVFVVLGTTTTPGTEKQSHGRQSVTSTGTTGILSGTPSYSRITQSAWRLTTGWKVRSSILGGTRGFLFVKTRPDRPWVPGSSWR
jgi:hypothetical protein